MRNSVRAILSAVIAVLAMAGGGGPASADQLAMPFQCRLERGRVLLVPAVERHYEILGAKSQQPFLHCPPNGNDRCRLRMLHRFDIACAGGRVPWMAVAAAIARQRGRDAFVDGGRLHLAAAPNNSAAADCFDAPSARAGTQAPRAAIGTLERPCWPRVGERAGMRVVSYPAGFAPLNESGARIVLGNARSPLAQVVAQQVAEPTITTPASVTTVDAAEPAGHAAVASPPLATAEPSADMLPQHALDPGLTLVSQSEQSYPIELANASWRPQLPTPWVVTVQSDSVRGAVEAGSRWPATAAVWVFVAALLTVSLAVAAVVARALPGAQRALSLIRVAGLGSLAPMLRRSWDVARAQSGHDHAVGDLQQTADRLRCNADALLDDLRSAAPLRGVLRQELDLIAHRLAAIPSPDGSEQSLKAARQRVQTGIRELHRVIKIAEGATASFAVRASRPRVPTSREEAYALLGVNDSANEATLKKLVDALRMSWHPDHASDEMDRQRREERIKQINIAWDLITAKRSAG